MPKFSILNSLAKFSDFQWEKTPHFRLVYQLNISLLLILIRLGSHRVIKDNSISELLTSFGKNFWVTLISKEPTIIVEKLSVNSRCSSIYKKLAPTPVDIALQTVKNSGSSEHKAVQA